MVGVLRLEVGAHRRSVGRHVAALHDAAQRLARVLVVRGRHGAARELGEVGAQRPAATGSFRKHVGHPRVRLVARAHDLHGGQPALAVAFHDDDVVPVHAAHDVGALHLALHRLDARHLPRRGDHRLARPGGAVAVRVLTGIVDVEAHVAVVLHAAHVVTARDQLGYELLDKRRLARVMAAHDSEGRAGDVHHVHAPVLSAHKYSMAQRPSRHSPISFRRPFPRYDSLQTLSPPPLPPLQPTRPPTGRRCRQARRACGRRSGTGARRRAALGA